MMLRQNTKKEVELEKNATIEHNTDKELVDLFASLQKDTC